MSIELGAQDGGENQEPPTTRIVETEAELKELARRRAELQMEAEAADDASQRLQELLEAARTRRDEAERRVHREEYERLREEQGKLEDDAESILNEYFAKQLELKELGYDSANYVAAGHCVRRAAERPAARSR